MRSIVEVVQNLIKPYIDSVKQALTNISITGTTNNTGATIVKGTYFYVGGILKRAKSDIAVNASITSSNTDTVPEGGLNGLNANIKYDSLTDAEFGDVPANGTIHKRYTLVNKTGYTLWLANGRLNYADSAIVSCQIYGNTTLDVFVINTKNITLPTQTLTVQLLYLKTANLFV